MISLICQATILINLSLFPWNKNDAVQKSRAEKRCSQLYSDAPCLVKFTKTGENDYRAICGAKK